MKVFGPRKKFCKVKNFAVYDIETTTDLKNVYLVGYYNGKEYRYFESYPLPPDDYESAISKFCMWYFNGNSRCAIYAHNGGNFDHLFVLKWLLAFCPKAKIEFVPIQSSILLMVVTIGKRTFEFRDSYRFMPASLDSLSKTLLGKGKMEGIDYDKLHLDERRYEYLERDCRDLYACIQLWKKTVEERLQGVSGLTAASTAVETLRKSYLPFSIEQLPKDVEEHIRRGYYGGRTEVFIKKGRFKKEHPLRCYDVNSMYPWAMSQPLPVKMFLNTMHYLNLNCAGYVECTVNTDNCDSKARQYPVLPLRKDGKLLFPLGTFRGVWSTVELKFALNHGYRIFDVGKAVYFKTHAVFEKYVKTLYELRDKNKKDYDETLSRIAKLLLNSTYGKFGTNREREKIWIKPSLSEILEKRMAPMQGPLDIPVFVEEVECNADYILPHLAAWVTALGRVRLLEFIYSCKEDVYYCDTDSVYTTSVLSTSNDLGALKEEYCDIVEAKFVAPKVYRLVHADNHETIKVKGFSTFGKGFIGSFKKLEAKESITCSAFSKLRTVIRGDFGLIVRNKHLLDKGEKRKFDKNGRSCPLVVEDAKDKTKEAKK